MESRSDATTAGSENDDGVSTRLWLLVAGSTVLGLAHHVDHVVRGNHVGWPVTATVNAFTLSLAIYPFLALGLYLTVTDRAGTGYWAVFSTVAAAMLASVHLSPWALEPPRDVVLPYADPAVGYAAFAVLLVLVALVTLTAAYASVLWYRRRR